MRTATFLIALGLFGTALSAPIAEPNSKFLFAKDPLSIHRRTVPDESNIHSVEDIIMTPEFQAEVESSSSTSSSSTSSSSGSGSGSEVKESSESEMNITSEPSEDSCAEICGIQRVEGAKSEREALCSSEGLLATLECAQCIDQTWPDTSYEDSAMNEYERIVSACNDSPQQ
ncbi:uncharacterized protein IL334_000394 [Kwoniella shivajii]|uniref:Uncharacterized protein n=1 Tax=Kwoniella shivajii TaxID=564305 RepID=A0ABZ1CP26_9TREE|nr:hypothetical protein IL334_000394 [Kwoniella shivajii]